MYKLYSNISNHDTILECWGGSTKHPDCLFRFSDFEKVDFIEPSAQIFQWVLECASKMNFPFHAESMAKWALANLITWRT